MDRRSVNYKDIRFGMLLGKIARMHATRADQLAERVGLYRGQAIMLLILSHHEGITHSELAEKLGISPAAATKVIKRLETLNYIRRASDEADERISRLFLQEEGRAVIRQIQHAFDQMDQETLDNFSEEERMQLIQLLVKVYENLAGQSLCVKDNSIP